MAESEKLENSESWGKTIIAGSRSITTYKIVADAIRDSGFKITEVVSGTARGVDSLGELWATINRIPCVRFPAKWHLYGRAAGSKRNKEMAQYANALIAVWDGQSKGTQNMIRTAQNFGLRVYVYDSTGRKTPSEGSPSGR